MICVFDADSLLYIHCWKNKDSNNFDDYISSLDDHIKQVVFHVGYTHAVFFLTENRKNFRTAIATTREYKGNRKANKPKFFYDLKAYLKTKYKAVSSEEYEADDLCLSYYLKADKAGMNPVLAAIDKDLKQIPCRYYDYKKMEMQEVSEDAAYYNLWIQVIAGDSTDGVPGLEGVGVKGAEKWLKGEVEVCSSLRAFEMYCLKYPILEAVNRFHETFNLVYIRRDVPVEAEVIEIIDKDYKPNELKEIEGGF